MHATLSGFDSAAPEQRVAPPRPAASPAFDLHAAMLDEVDYGMLLVTEGLRVLRCNHAARMALRSEQPLWRRNGQLGAADADDELRLQAAVQAASERSQRGLITLRGGDAAALSVAVVPLKSSPGQRAEAVLLVLGRQELCARLSTQRLATDHGLTPAESAVLAALVEGFEPREIADRHGVKLSTVRTQVQSIFDKLGVRGIRQLFMKVATLPPLMNALRF
jgi:DNA-binding CsgD family transcriptional regulator